MSGGADLSPDERAAADRIARILHSGTVEEIDALIEMIDAAERFSIALEAARQRLHDAPPAGTA